MNNDRIQRLYNIVFPLLKISSTQPSIPYGHENDAFLEVLRADISYWRYILFGWGLYATVWVLASVIITLVLALTMPILLWVLIPIVMLGFCKVAISYVVARVGYDLRWYTITDSTISIRQGALTLREITVSFQNIQNIRVTQGPLERVFGFSNITIDTAAATTGKQGEGGSPNIAVLRGISNANTLRDVILSRLNLFRDAGLGDPDDELSEAYNTRENRERLAALECLAREASLLRSVVEK